MSYFFNVCSTIMTIIPRVLMSFVDSAKYRTLAIHWFSAPLLWGYINSLKHEIEVVKTGTRTNISSLYCIVIVENIWWCRLILFFLSLFYIAQNRRCSIYLDTWLAWESTSWHEAPFPYSPGSWGSPQIPAVGWERWRWQLCSNSPSL